MSTANNALLFLLLSVVATEICVGRRDGNQRLKSCCARQKAADKSCKRKFCDFEVLNKDNILFFLNTCSTKGTTVRDMWDCATSKQDHTECCKIKSVVPECLAYCSHNTAPANYLQHLFCVQSFNPIRDCFREHLEQNPNIFGDA
ncbi:Protein F18C5.9 [Aphelenchoides avenae]|nr:Protein F18C5.9 [Aphelenchus avenae]